MIFIEKPLFVYEKSWFLIEQSWFLIGKPLFVNENLKTHKIFEKRKYVGTDVNAKAAKHDAAKVLGMRVSKHKIVYRHRPNPVIQDSKGSFIGKLF